MNDDEQNDVGEIETPEVAVLPPAKTLRVGIDIDRDGRGAVRLCLVRIRVPLLQVENNVNKEANKWSNDVWAQWCGPKPPTKHGKVVMESFLVPEGQLPSSYEGKYIRATTKERALVQRIFDRKRFGGRTTAFRRTKVAVLALIAGIESIYDVEELYSIYGARGRRTVSEIMLVLLYS